MVYPENFEHKIGFDTIREMLDAECVSAMGRELVAEMRFETEAETIEQTVRPLAEYLSMADGGATLSLGILCDLRGELSRIRIEGTTISFDMLPDLKTTLRSASLITSFARNAAMAEYPALAQVLNRVRVDGRMVTELDRLVDDKGVMPDNASPELYAIRRSMEQKRGLINNRIHKILAEAKSAGWTDAQSEATIRNGHTVIPVKASDKRHLRGFIHDESATGQTVYIEPVEIFEADSQMRELEYAEKREMARILAEFTKTLRPHLPELMTLWNALGEVDFLNAKMKLARKTESLVPEFDALPHVDLRQARHPLLQAKLKQQGKEVVPLDLKLDGDNRILIISGPNAGGKSVCLKTVGLLQYMFQCCLAIPVSRNSRCGLFHDIFIDIGDEQSLENDLSTYSSHLLNMKNLLEMADDKTMFLVDEFGSGTEPQLGGSIAEAVVLRLNDKKCFGVVTTHYANLKLLADNHNGFVNGAMLFDTRFMQPLYMLVMGRPGSSFAFEMARKIGLPKDVLDKAADISGKSHLNFEKQIQQIEIEKKEIRKKETELRMADKMLNEVVEKYKTLAADLEQKKRHVIHDANVEARTLIENVNREIEHIIKEIKESQADRETTIRLRKTLDDKKHELEVRARELEDKPRPKEKNETLKVGDFVTIDDMEVAGELTEVSDTDVTVMFDNVRLRTSPDKVTKMKRSEYKKAQKKGIRYFENSVANNLSEKSAHFDLTLDVRGQRAEEALENVAKYLDEAMLLSIKEVSILHGKGNGILRKLIREYLSRQKSVSSFNDATLETGGTGITRVSLR